MGNKITRRRPAIDERYTRPQGLYPHRDVDQRKLRRLILDAKLAPCYPGGEEPAAELEECPICFLHYPSLNRSKCCSKGICTECFLQMKSPHAARPTQCPFCKTPNYAVEFRGAKTLEEKGVEQAEEQKVIEAKIRMRQQELQDDEEREQRREDEIREGGISPQPPPATVPDGASSQRPWERGPWRTAWGSIGRSSHQTPQGPVSSALFERPGLAVDPDSLWVRGRQQSEAGDGTGGPRLGMPPLASNVLPSIRSRNAAVTGMGPGPGPVRLPTSRYNRFSRDDDFDLDLEDIMVMEAIWLSIQERGASQNHADNESSVVAPGSLAAVVTHGEVRQQDDQPGENGDLTGHATLRARTSAVPEGRDQPARWGSVTGGLAGAIAAMAERQVASGDGTTVSHLSQPSVSAGDVNAEDREHTESDSNHEGEISERLPESWSSEPLNMNDGRLETASSSETGEVNKFPETDGREDNRGEVVPPQDGREVLRTMEKVVSGGVERSAMSTSGNVDSSEGLAEWVSSTKRARFISEYTGEYDRDHGSITEWGGDGSSEQVEVGTSFSSSIPSASELPWEAPEIPSDVATGDNNGAVEGGKLDMVPESFEEQMMLAMALSLAEAQARIEQEEIS